MIKPSRKVAALVVTAGLMLSSVAVSAGDSVVILNQSNVGISAAVDRYVEATADKADYVKGLLLAMDAA